MIALRTMRALLERARRELGRTDDSDLAALTVASYLAIPPARILATDGALVMSDSDEVVLVGTTSGTKAAVLNFGPAEPGGGARFTVSCDRFSGGAYTIACTRGVTAGVVTIDALGEAPSFQRIGGTLQLVALNGATFA